MADALAALSEGFQVRLYQLLDRHQGLVRDLGNDDARALGVRAAEAALAPLIWAEAMGERWSTAEVTGFLAVSRQALHKQVRNGKILGVPGRGTTWFPVWQFDQKTNQVRPEVAKILAAFRDRLDHPDPHLVASWANTPQPELDTTPADWLAEGKDPAEVVRLARLSAGELAA